MIASGKRIILLLPILMLLTVPFIPTFGQQQCIALEGFRWPRNYIGVYIAGGVADNQRQEVLFGLNVWLAAQAWYIDSYKNGQGTPYLFYLTDERTDGTITISFLIGEGLSFGGLTTYSYGGTFPNIQIQINLPQDKASNSGDPYVEGVITHELGHALGLGHSQIQGDTMYGGVDTSPEHFSIPSTLDLEAIYQLSQNSPSQLGSSSCLPDNIGYGIPPWLGNNGQLNLPVYPDGYGQWSFERPIVYPPTITVGTTDSITLQFKNMGQYPLQIASATAIPDFTARIQPTVSLPATVESGSEEDLIFNINVPSSTSLGEHTITFQLSVNLLSTQGWTPYSQEFTSSINQVFATPAVVTGFTLAVSQFSPTSVENAQQNSFSSLTLPLLVMTGAIVFVGLLVYTDYHRSKKHFSKLHSGKLFCMSCGRQLPLNSKYCFYCGSLVKNEEN